jgi:E3 ubiquitin-protein ligase MARCH6
MRLTYMICTPHHRESLSDVPIDLVLLHLLLPYTMHYLRPVKALKKVAEYVWRFLAARLRLTSYMFGGRHNAEEFSIKRRPWQFSIRRSGFADEFARVYDGTFRRVPATDNIALPTEMQATAQVTEGGVPANDEARVLIAAQDAETEKAKRIIKDDYTIVYVPPYFRQRLILFIASLWSIGSMCLGILLAAPMLLGRAAFRLVLAREVHDGYSFILGFYLLWACYVFGKAVDRMDKRRQRRGGEGHRGDLPVYVFKRSVLWFAKISYMVLLLGLVIPTLIAIVMELYLILPVRYVIDPHTTPRIRIADMWCLGILYSKIALHASQFQPPSRVSLGIRNVGITWFAAYCSPC